MAMRSVAVPSQRPAPRRSPSPDRRQADLIRRATDYCADAVTSSALAAIEEHATAYISEQTWNRLRRAWNPRRCERLAQYARGVLDGRQAIHRLIGKTAGRLAGAIGMAPPLQVIIDEITTRIPLPLVDHEAVIVSRALQITGVVMCIAHDRPLGGCTCFTDVVIAEGKDKMNQLLLRGAHNWKDLYLVPARSQPST